MKKTGSKLLILSLAFLIAFAAVFIPAGGKSVYAAGTKKSDYKIYAVKVDKSLFYYDGKYHKPKITAVWAYDTKTGKRFKLAKKYCLIMDGESAGRTPKYHRKCGQYSLTVAGAGKGNGHPVYGIETVYWTIDLKPMKKTDIRAVCKGNKKDKLKITVKLPPHDSGYYLGVEDETTGEIIYSYTYLHGKKRTVKTTVSIGVPNNHIYGIYTCAYANVKKINAHQFEAYASDAYRRVRHNK